MLGLRRKNRGSAVAAYAALPGRAGRGADRLQRPVRAESDPRRGGGSGADISRTETATLFGIAASATTRTYALGTTRARAGVAFGQFMVYGTGGFAWAVNELSGMIGGVGMSDARTHSGYTFGAGLEWMITPAWTARAEYLYAHFGSRTYFGGTVASGDVDANIVRVGVNYLFK